MDSSNLQLIVLALSWIAYGAVHSLTAATGFKRIFQQRFPGLFPAYRLLYNLTAGLLLVIPLWLLWRYEGELLWQWDGLAGWIVQGTALLALLGFVYSLTLYDGSDFTGLKQFREKRQNLQEVAPMSLSWLHRHIRHPLYFFGLIIIWAREMNAAWLVSAVCLTAYLITGSRLEDKKLVASYGEQYRRYRQKVCGLVPLPWRFLSKDEAGKLLTENTS